LQQGMTTVGVSPSEGIYQNKWRNEGAIPDAGGGSSKSKGKNVAGPN